MDARIDVLRGLFVEGVVILLVFGEFSAQLSVFLHQFYLRHTDTGILNGHSLGLLVGDHADFRRLLGVRGGPVLQAL